MITAYYNEIDPFAVAWLRELIKAGHIAPGVVDDRSIEDVYPHDLAGFTQCHFFAGIGVWSYALRCAGWPDDRPVWTGSCPCQPFSAAGKGGGFADERHLWHAFFHLISQCRPGTVFGEQVASRDGLAWFDLVQTDMEAAGYACGAVDTCAAGIGAPHIRQRLYWVADAMFTRWAERRPSTGGRPVAGSGTTGGLPYAESGGSRAGLCDCEPGKERRSVIADGGADRGMGDAISAGLEGYAGHGPGAAGRQKAAGSVAETGGIDGVGNTSIHRCGTRGNNNQGYTEQLSDAAFQNAHTATNGAGPTNSFWRDADWLLCRDGKWRPVEPGTFPLAHGASNRVGRLRGYGNAIVAPQAEAFIRAYLELEQDSLQLQSQRRRK